MTLSRYLPLDDAQQEIRLLEVHPGMRNDSISCSVKHVSLSAQPAYETISYCWGGTTAYDVVQLDDTQVRVGQNAADALRRMRRQETKRFLWIDQLCINQQDLSERSRQVALMKDIYSASEGNLVYLGGPVPWIDAAARSLKLIRETMVEEAVAMSMTFEELLYEYYAGRASADVELSQTLPPAIDYTALGCLFRLSWLTRVWVVQEAALAPSNTCYLGDVTIDLVEIMRAGHWCYSRRDLLPPILRDAPGIDQARFLGRFLDFKFSVYRNMAVPRASLVSLLEIQMSLEATDPRDRVFSMTGLTQFATLPRFPPELIPDYKKTEVAVFLSATRLAIWERGLHRMLMFVAHRSQEDLLSNLWPSWMPRWNRPFKLERDPRTMLPVTTAYRKALAESFEMPDNPHLLTVHGLLLDRVERCSSVLEAEDNSDVQRWTQDVQDMASPTSVFEAKLGIAVTLAYGEQARFQRGNDPGFRVEDPSYQLKKVDSAQEPCVVRSVSLSTPEEVEPIARNALRHRRFFLTTSGDLGVGPRLLQTGDLIVQIEDVRAPYALRAETSGGGYRVVGLCHTNRWVADRRALQSLNECEGGKLQQFVLC